MNKILRFTSASCGPCKLLAKNLESADLGVDIEVVDIDVHPEVAEEYGIRSVPTLVYVKEGSEAGRMIGVKPTLAVEDWAKSL